MGPGQINGQAVRNQLKQVLSSAGFARNARLSGFLRFLVERHLEGRDAELKESLIAIQVFDRRPDYDPKQDAIVRTEAVRLRARLRSYYAGEGSRAPVIIELPKGGYVPAFREGEPAGEMNARQRSRLRTRLWMIVALAGFVVAIAAVGWWRLHYGNAPVPIAVLPLVNLSQNPAEDYFADGLSGEIIRNLSIIDGMAVRSQTSSFTFKGKPRNLREIGKQLAADYVLEGSVLRSGQQLRINVQLVRVRDDFALWSGRYDEELTDIFKIQDEVSRGVVNSLRLKLGRGRRRYETSVQAYDLYLRARALQQRAYPLGYSQSIGPLEDAIVKDPSFAPAYAGLAAAIVVRSSADTLFDDDDELARMRVTAEKAIQLDPLLPEAHDALGMSYAREGQWEQSEKSFRHAIGLDPSSSMSHDHFAFNLLLPLGRVEEAVRELRVAAKADPLSSEVRNQLAFTLISAGKFDEAASQCEKVSAEYPLRNQCLGRALMGQGRVGEAIPFLATSEVNNWGFLAYAYARMGRRVEAQKLMAEAPMRYPDRRGPFQFALAFAGLGDKDRTIEQLALMAGAGPVRLGRDLTFPEFALVRGDARVKALRKKIGLPE